MAFSVEAEISLNQFVDHNETLARTVQFYIQKQNCAISEIKSLGTSFTK